MPNLFRIIKQTQCYIVNGFSKWIAKGVILQLSDNFLAIFSHLLCHRGPRNEHCVCIIQFVPNEAFISFVTYIMINSQQPMRTKRERQSMEGVGKSPIRKMSVFEPIERDRDEELYVLCQQLTRDNWALQKHVNKLKQRLDQRQASQCLSITESDVQDYRSINYECYKKKANTILSSVRYLHKLYIEGDWVKQKSKMIDDFMDKLSNGGNTVDQLLNHFSNAIQQQQSNTCWDIEELEKESSQFQNNILRGYIVKLNSILMQVMDSFRKDINEIKKSYTKNRQKISQQIKYYCSNYLPATKIQKSNSVNSNMGKKKINKAVKKKINHDQNRNESDDWQKIVEERSKLREERACQPNVAESLSESLAMSNALQNSCIQPLSVKILAKPPIPKYRHKDRKDNLSVVNETQCQRIISNMIVTPRSNASLNRETQIKNEKPVIDKRQQTPNWKSYKQSPNRNHYR